MYSGGAVEGERLRLIGECAEPRETLRDGGWAGSLRLLAVTEKNKDAELDAILGKGRSLGVIVASFNGLAIRALCNKEMGQVVKSDESADPQGAY